MSRYIYIRQVPLPSDFLQTDRIFAQSSFWYQVIPDDAPVHANNANLVATFLDAKAAAFGTIGINGTSGNNVTSFCSPVYYPSYSEATQAVAMYDGGISSYPNAQLISDWSAVPFPTGAVPANGSDHECCVYQASTSTIWEFWKLITQGAGGPPWKGAWGGKMINANQSDGIWPYHFGTTASGLPFLGGQLTAEELTRGEIRHAMGFTLTAQALEHYTLLSWPANRSDGWNPNGNPNRIRYGQRFRLNPSVDVNALNMHPMGKIIAKAIQKYGLVVWDQGGAMVLRAQNSLSYTYNGGVNPYTALWNGTSDFNILANMPWDQLLFLPLDYGKP